MPQKKVNKLATGKGGRPNDSNFELPCHG